MGCCEKNVLMVEWLPGTFLYELEPEPAKKIPGAAQKLTGAVTLVTIQGLNVNVVATNNIKLFLCGKCS